MQSHGLNDSGLRRRLMDLYLHLGAYPEVGDTLKQLKASGMHLAILSNGTPAMLSAAVDHPGITALLGAVLSVEEVGVFKPHPSVHKARTPILATR